ncbi:hypothetical protein BCEP4_2060006 [Burkholderia cepacia]|nr:hypothetical protein BCEP4_2060006 [Burkholderia cepacia]
MHRQMPLGVYDRAARVGCVGAANLCLTLRGGLRDDLRPARESGSLERQLIAYLDAHVSRAQRDVRVAEIERKPVAGLAAFEYRQYPATFTVNAYLHEVAWLRQYDAAYRRSGAQLQARINCYEPNAGGDARIADSGEHR